MEWLVVRYCLLYQLSVITIELISNIATDLDLQKVVNIMKQVKTLNTLIANSDDNIIIIDNIFY